MRMRAFPSHLSVVRRAILPAPFPRKGVTLVRGLRPLRGVV